MRFSCDKLDVSSPLDVLNIAAIAATDADFFGGGVGFCIISLLPSILSPEEQSSFSDNASDVQADRKSASVFCDTVNRDAGTPLALAFFVFMSACFHAGTSVSSVDISPVNVIVVLFGTVVDESPVSRDDGFANVLVGSTFFEIFVSLCVVRFKGLGGCSDATVVLLTLISDVNLILSRYVLTGTGWGSHSVFSKTRSSSITKDSSSPPASS